MKSQEVREKFTNFFLNHAHKKYPSSSLIPHNDPTLLFTNAGMNQFKDYFTGKAQAKDKRAVSIQKCVRAGGKHNDLENVGFTARHHTFFEMLGNFSFGDYFKNDAIRFSWAFLTQELKIPKERLLITVHESDDEAKEIWHKQEGVPLDRIFKLGDKDNFWEMGEFGPCGPCTEIFYDHGEKFSDGNYDPKSPLKDEGRFIEIWNLVFMQFEKTPQGTHKLPQPSVDTGAGFERLCAVMQGVYWNYDTDLFQTIIKEIEKLSGKKYTDSNANSSMRVIADHVRAATMLITDGALPSNEGRGYVLRRIIRRAVRHLNELGLQKPSLYQLVPAVFATLGKEYPDNLANQNLAEKLLLQEEVSFRETLAAGLKILNDEIKLLKSTTLPGTVAFKLYDTFGFPLDLTEVILREKNLNLDHTAFEVCMKKQKEVSKQHSHFKVQGQDTKIFFDLLQKHGTSKFLGYQSLTAKAKVLDVIHNNDVDLIITNQTPFYAESGGQAGDRGYISIGKDKLEVLDTQAPVDGLIAHVIKATTSIKKDSEVTLEVSSTLRSSTAKNHSATHLLQAALVKTLGTHVKQAGSQVTADRLRFDFTHSESLKKNQLREIELLVNSSIQVGHTVSSNEMSKNDAIKKGATALFGEKYGDVVRVISMGDVSTELCGGTHVTNTTDIQLFVIISESSLSAGVRRLEATTGQHALNYLLNRSDKLADVESMLSTSESAIKQKISTLLDDLKSKQKEIDTYRQKTQTQSATDLFKNPESLNGHNFYSTAAPAADSDLRTLSDVFVEKFPNDILFLYKRDEDKFSFIMRINRKKSLDLSNCSKELATIGVRAGGKPDLIQGSFSTDSFGPATNAIKNFLSRTK